MERAITIGLETRKSIKSEMLELNMLVEAAGAEVVRTITQKKDRAESRTLFGPGKVEEIRDFVEADEADVVVVNHELSGSQLRNLEEIIDCKIIDRTNLILDIFALRATSKEGQLQVALAQLEYRLPRIIGFSDYLSRAGSGIGTRGPGEQKLETDRRHIEREIYSIKRQLKTVERQRDTKRQRRMDSNVPIVSFIGYTNAGKSTLMNKLMTSDEEMFVKDMLFATLDTSLRKAMLPSGEAYLLADTVGFVSNLPTALVEAFKSTLEEIEESDLIIHVLDASNEELEIQMQTTHDILEDMDVLDKKVLTVFNKMDQVENEDFIIENSSEEHTIFISALEEEDIDSLQMQIQNLLQEDYQRKELMIPFNSYAIYDEISNNFVIEKESSDETGTTIQVYMNKVDLERYKDFYKA